MLIDKIIVNYNFQYCILKNDSIIDSVPNSLQYTLLF